MITIKTKRANETTKAHEDIYLDGKYIGYVIKADQNSPTQKGWFFVNDSEIKEFTETKFGYNSSLNETTKTKLIRRLKEIANKLIKK